jgi:hypothetical protein
MKRGLNMKRMRIDRILLGGLATALSFVVIEMILEGIVHVLFGINEKELLLEAFPRAILSGARYHIVNIGYLLAFCVFITWLYAALIPRFGKGSKTALIAALAFYSVAVLFMINHVNMGIFPMKSTLLSMLFSLVELPAATVIGARFYRED